jgi:methionyl-tRNA formyltransferase
VNLLKIIFAGSGEFGLPTLRALVGVGHKIVGVYTQPDRPAGRGRQLAATPIAQAAETMGLAVTRTDDLNSLSFLPPADLMVVIAFGQKISQEIANHARLGSINLHASLLPKFRGAAPINWAILSGEKTTGNSVIRLANRMDAGAILGQSQLTIGETETAGELHDRLAIDGATLVCQVATDLDSGSATERQQDESAATIAPKLSRETAKLDWSAPAEIVARRINGLSPWPGCRVKLLDTAGAELSQLALLRAKPIFGSPAPPPGSIMENGAIATGRGSVELLDVQPAGKRPMATGDFRRGHRWTAGLTVVSV